MRFAPVAPVEVALFLNGHGLYGRKWPAILTDCLSSSYVLYFCHHTRLQR